MHDLIDGELNYKEAYWTSANGINFLIEVLKKRVVLIEKDLKKERIHHVQYEELFNEQIYYKWLLTLLENIASQAETVAIDDAKIAVRKLRHLEIVD